ncbi:hypothetical protein GCM10028895_47670 [Pontibacter rugosus]
MISFTNKAANSLREKIQEAINMKVTEAKSSHERLRWREQQERLATAYIGTIHGFCRQILKLFGYMDLVSYEAKVTFAKRIRDEVFLEAILEHFRGGPAASLYGSRSQMADHELIKLMGSIYEHVRNMDLDFKTIREWTEQQEEDAGKAYRVSMAKLMEQAVEAYTGRKRWEQVLDSHDLLKKTSELLTQSENRGSIVKQIAKRYHYLFVDEFQDTDAVQEKIVEALLPSLTSVLVVGDQKQSIYGFRGTLDNLLLRMAKNHHQLLLPMNISRRPANQFREMVNTLFGHISRQSSYAFLGDSLEAYEGIAKGEGDPPPLVYLSAEYNQGIPKASEAIQKLLSGKYTLEYRLGKHAPIEQGDIVVLTRTNAIAEAYAEGLREAFAGLGIVVKADTGNTFYALPEIVSVIYILQLLLTYPKDDAALTLALDTPFLQTSTKEELNGEKLRQLQKRVGGSPLSEAFMDFSPELHEILVELQAMMRVATVPQILEHLYRKFGIREYYHGQSDEQAVKNLEYLRDVSRNLFTEDQALTLHTFVDFLRTSNLSGREEELVTPPDPSEEKGVKEWGRPTYE